MKNSRANVSGLTSEAQLKHLNACAKAEKGIEKLLHKNTPITFEAVAKASGVSRAFLYKDSQLRERINSLKARNHPKNSPPTNQRASDASLNAIIDALRCQIQQQHKEIDILSSLLEGSRLTPQEIESYDFIAENKRLREELELTKTQLNRAVREHQELTALVNQLKSQNKELKTKLAGWDSLQAEKEELKKQNSHVTELLKQATSWERQKNIKMFAQALKQEDKFPES